MHLLTKANQETGANLNVNILLIFQEEKESSVL